VPDRVLVHLVGGHACILLANARELGDLDQILIMTSQLTELDVEQGATETATARVREVVEIAETLQHKEGLVRSCGLLGIIFTAKGNFERSAELIVKAQEIASEMGITLHPGLENAGARARAELGEDAWLAASSAARDADVLDLLRAAVDSLNFCY